MAVVYVTELWRGRRGKSSLDRRRQYVRVFEVRTDSALDDSTLVEEGDGSTLPTLGEVHPTDDEQFAVDVDSDQHEEDPTLWTVTVNYDTQIPIQQSIEYDDEGNASVGDPELIADDPTERPPIIEFSFTNVPFILKRVKQYVGDTVSGGVSIALANGTSIYDSSEDFEAGLPVGWTLKSTGTEPNFTYIFSVINSAGLPPDPPVEAEEARTVITHTQNIPVDGFNVSEAKTLANAVNSEPWLGLDERTLRVTGIGYKPKTENGVTFFERTLTITEKPDTWDIEFQDRGFDRFIPGSMSGDPPAKWSKITDPSGRDAPPQGYPLNGNGTPLPAGNQLVYLKYRYYPEIDFGVEI